MFAEKFRKVPHNIVVKHVDRRVVRMQGRQHRGVSVQHRLYQHLLPSQPCAHKAKKLNPVFDGRVLIDLGTYQSLDEGQREMLKEHGLVVNIVNS